MKVTLVLATVTMPLPTTPSGVAAFGFRRFTVVGSDPVDTATNTAEFDLPGGVTYDATEQDFAADGSPLGAVQTLSFTVPADAPAPTPPAPATYEAANGLSVTFG